MITYRSRGSLNFFRNLLRLHGSVFPQALSIAFPLGSLTGLLSWLHDAGYVKFYVDTDVPLMEEAAVWGSFTGLVGFLVIFRTSISYTRFWDGMTCTHKMRAEWFDAVASLCAFCRYSQESPAKIQDFQNLLVRLFSLLHAVALAEIEDSSSSDDGGIHAFGLQLLDDRFIDDQSLLALRNSISKPELVFQWIQQLVVENMRTKILSIPPPILSRSFQEMANGMVEFHEALKVSMIPFPLPYAQCCDVLLLCHAVMTPFIITHWVNDIYWAIVLSFLQVFILWSLRFIAIELENPFGMDANDLDQHVMQNEMNAQLALLVSPYCQRTPTLSRVRRSTPTSPSPSQSGSTHGTHSSLNDAWHALSHGRGVSLISRSGSNLSSALSRSDGSVTRTSIAASSCASNEAPVCSEKIEPPARSVRHSLRMSRDKEGILSGHRWSPAASLSSELVTMLAQDDERPAVNRKPDTILERDAAEEASLGDAGSPSNNDESVTVVLTSEQTRPIQRVVSFVDMSGHDPGESSCNSNGSSQISGRACPPRARDNDLSDLTSLTHPSIRL